MVYNYNKSWERHSVPMGELCFGCSEELKLEKGHLFSEFSFKDKKEYHVLSRPVYQSTISDFSEK